MKRLLALDFLEHQRIPWIIDKREYYRATGDYSVYSLPPVILLDDGLSFDSFLKLEKDMLFSIPEFSDGISYLRPEIRIPGIKGLFISERKDAMDYEWNQIIATPVKLLMIEMDGLFSRIIASRCVSTDRDLK